MRFKVTPLYGSLIEGGGTVIFSILSKRINASIESEKLSTVLNSVLDTLLVIMGEYNKDMHDLFKIVT